MAFNLLKKFDRSNYQDDLNRSHKPDSRIVIFTGLLVLFGLVVIYAIGPARANVLNHAYGSDYSSNYFFIKQLISIAIAVVVFVLMSKISYKFWLNNAQRILILGIGSCILLAIAGLLHSPIAQCSLGACRWFELGPLGSFQPAELLKFGLVIFLAQFFAIKISAGKMNDVSETLTPLAVLIFIVSVFVIGIQRDMGTGISMIGIVLAMLVVGGINMKIGLKLGAGLLVLGVLFILIAPHRIDRVVTFLKGDNTTTSDSSSYHVEHAKIALGTGGFSGVGIGNSVEATGYLPEAINDSVFAIIGEMFGFVGSVILLSLFVGLLMRMLKILDHLHEMRLKLLVAGVFGWLASHVILNVASMLGLFPLTGITLPLLSFGGTSLIFMAAIIGLVFQLSHYTSNVKSKESSYENIGSRRGFRGTRHTSSRRSS
jgi:cell division protein FtsW